VTRESWKLDWEAAETPLGLPGQRTAVCVRTSYRPLGARFPWKPAEIRYYASSAGSEEADFAQIIRDHWRIENCLHHPKDRTWLEDRHWVGSPRTGALISVLRSLACCLVRKAPCRAVPSSAHCPERIEYYRHKPKLAMARIIKPLRL
jgi:hypothetical protein